MSLKNLFAASLVAVPAMASDSDATSWLEWHPQTVTVTKVIKAYPETETVTECPSTSASSLSSLDPTSYSMPTSAPPDSGSHECPTTVINGTYPVLTATASEEDYGLHAAATDAGKLWLGTAADIPGTGSFLDPYYMEAFNNSLDFGQATPANAMKWLFSEPSQGEFNYTGGDFFLDLVEGTDKYVTCHNLVWHTQLPDWVNEPDEPWTNETLSAVMVNHIENVVAHFGDRCDHWDVVNEAFLDGNDTVEDGDYRDTIFYNTIGPEYLPLAFSTAQRIVERDNLSVKLYYNDYNIENIGGKSDAARALVQQLKDRGIQIDGVGLQSHFIAGSAPSQADQEENMRAFIDTGVEVGITEIDVRIETPANISMQITQVEDYYNTVAACVAVEGCRAITLWDFVDSYSWIPYTFEDEGFGTPWIQPQYVDTPLLPKAAYDGILAALRGEDMPMYECGDSEES